MKKLSVLLPFFVLAGYGVLAGCGGPGQYTPKKVEEQPKVDLSEVTSKTLVPLEEGKSWTYAYETTTRTQGGENDSRGTLQFLVRKVTQTAKGTEALIEIMRDDKVVDKQRWLANPAGLYQLTSGDNDVAFTPMQPLALFPLEKNADFKWVGKGICPDGEMGRMEANSRVLGSLPADTSLGRQEGVAIETKTAFRSTKVEGALVVTTWYKPNVGIIRLKQILAVKGGNITTTLTLSKAQ